MKNRKSHDGVALSGAYRHDTGGEVPKFDFSPRRYDYPGDGYSLFHHAIFKGAVDSVMSNHSRLDLTAKMGLGAIMGGSVVLDQSDLMIFTALKAHNDKFLKVSGGEIYANAASATREGMFLFLRRENGRYFEIFNGGRNCVVNPDTMNVEIGDKAADGGRHLYRFGIKNYNGSNRLMIHSLMNQPWGLEFASPYVWDDSGAKNTDVTFDFGTEGRYKVTDEKTEVDGKKREYWIERRGVQRFWSLFDGSGAKIPSDVYGTEGNIVKCNGILWGSGRNVSNVNPVFGSASNNYVFRASGGTDIASGIVLGYVGRLVWVQYHGDLFDKIFNQTMTPKEIVDSISPNFMVDLPYETQIDEYVSASGTESWRMQSAREKLDVMQLKNTLTPARDFGRKS